MAIRSVLRSHRFETESGWSAWEQIAGAEIASSPDCTVTDDGGLHVVARTISGAIVYVRGDGGDFEEVDIGVFE